MLKQWKLFGILGICFVWLMASGCNVSDNTHIRTTPGSGNDTGISGEADATTEPGDVGQVEDTSAPGEEDASEPDAAQDAYSSDDAGDEDAGDEDAGDDDAGDDDAGDDDAGDEDAGFVSDCTGVADDTPCGESLAVGIFGDCLYRDVCVTSGVRSRTDSVQVCEAEQCVVKEQVVTETCGERETEGHTCGLSHTTRPTVCTRIDETSCSGEGAQTVVTTHNRCDASGSCRSFEEPVSQLCELDADGMSCGSAGTGTCVGTCCEPACTNPPNCLLCPRFEIRD